LWKEGVWEDETEGSEKLTTDDIGVTELISSKKSASLTYDFGQFFDGGEGLPRARQPKRQLRLVSMGEAS